MSSSPSGRLLRSLGAPGASAARRASTSPPRATGGSRSPSGSAVQLLDEESRPLRDLNHHVVVAILVPDDVCPCLEVDGFEDRGFRWRGLHPSDEGGRGWPLQT